MSDFCPHCDDFSIDASRAGRIEELERPAKSKGKATNPKKTHRPAKKRIVINVDNSDENSDWIKSVRDSAQREKTETAQKTPGSETAHHPRSGYLAEPK